MLFKITHGDGNFERHVQADNILIAAEITAKHFIINSVTKIEYIGMNLLDADYEPATCKRCNVECDEEAMIEGLCQGCYDITHPM